MIARRPASASTATAPSPAAEPGAPAAPALLATYRLQLGPAFGLARAREVVPYLARLGISHVYLSPVLRSRPGSTHGYDVVDPTRLDPELGSDEDWRALVRELRARGMGIVLDIVPNHMGVGADNPFWDDLFANGPASRYASWFDVDWSDQRPGFRGRIVVPILDDELDAVIARDEIIVGMEGGRLRARWRDHSFPVDPTLIPRVLEPALETLRAESAAGNGEVEELGRVLDALLALPPRLARDDRRVEQRRREAPELLRALEALYGASPHARAAIDRAAMQFGAGRAGHGRMRAFLDSQVYALAYWRGAAHRINYRRFFDIDALVALRAEDPEVFGATHRRVVQWVKDGDVDGLRIDHVDGLAEPRQYLERLRAAVERVRAPGAAERFPIFVEKVLAADERLRDDWPVEGSTGYEVAADVDALFVHADGYAEIERRYRALLGIRRPDVTFAELAHAAKALVLRTSLAADVRRLGRAVAIVAARDPRAARLPRAHLREAVVQLIASLGVYRTYVEPETGRVHPDDRRELERALADARRRADAPADALGLLDELLLLRAHQTGEAGDRHARARCVRRFQQTSGPAAAKGVEDTALYRWMPLLSLDEVGSSPDHPVADAVERLHRANAERQARWPRALHAATTHDSKRGADVRARISVLSEIPDEWWNALARWRRAMRHARAPVRGRLAPDANTEYAIYQTLVGAWPVAPDATAERAELRARVAAWARKAAREAKARTSWVDPDPDFEHALAAYVGALFDDVEVSRDVAAFAARVARAGAWNAVARTLLQCTAPGTPDVYQGDEMWNLVLVDPDNRRPADFAARERALASLDGVDARALVAQPADGRLKLWVLARALRARREHASLFRDGAYVPLRAEGDRAAHAFAFLRREAGAAALTVVPRHTVALGALDRAPVGTAAWGNTRLVLPGDLARVEWHAHLSGATAAPGPGAGGALALADVLALAPVELLTVTFPG
ncbi:MAG TPA: malto-oligosyltrehalose synthase [Gemmatimonadaceae bacterium]